MAYPVILLIEPEAVVRELLLLCLGKLGGWNVIPAASVQVGWAWLKAQQPDAIVLDTAVPESDRLTFIQALSGNISTASIPVLLLINHAAWLNSDSVGSGPVVGAIAKPFNPTTLPIEVAHLLGWRLACDLAAPSPTLGESPHHLSESPQA
jgi:CheY-like chemotaxis protein